MARKGGGQQAGKRDPVTSVVRDDCKERDTPSRKRSLPGRDSWRDCAKCVARPASVSKGKEGSLEDSVRVPCRRIRRGGKEVREGAGDGGGQPERRQDKDNKQDKNKEQHKTQKGKGKKAETKASRRTDSKGRQQDKKTRRHQSLLDPKHRQHGQREKNMARTHALTSPAASCTVQLKKRGDRGHWLRRCRASRKDCPAWRRGACQQRKGKG